MNILLFISFCAILAVTFFTGKYIIHDGHKDFGKDKDFPPFHGSPKTSWGHVLVGMICGVLIFPAKYNVAWEEPDKPEEMNKFVWLRQGAGLIIFLIYTIRNFIKHPRSLRNRLDGCGLGQPPNIFYSSVTRQQLQFVMGVAIAILIANFANPGTKFDIKHKSSHVTVMIIGVTLGQIILQMLLTSDSAKYQNLRRRYIKCANKLNEQKA